METFNPQKLPSRRLEVLWESNWGMELAESRVVRKSEKRTKTNKTIIIIITQMIRNMKQ